MIEKGKEVIRLLIKRIALNKLDIIRSVCCLLIFGSCCSYVHAEKKIYHGYGEYTMSDYESPQIAEQRALSYARKNIMEQAGVYVRTYTRTQNMKVTDDQVYIATNSLLKIINQDKKTKTISGGGVHIEVYLTADIETDGINKMVKEENAKYDINYDDLQNDMKRIEFETNEIKQKIVKRRKNNEPIEGYVLEMKSKEQEFLANEKIEESAIEYKRENFRKAAMLGDEAIKLNPKKYEAYLKAADGYGGLGNYDMSFKRYSQALVLNKQEARIYNNRGVTYAAKNNYDKAVLDYTRAIEINGKFAMAYYNRALVYVDLKKYDKALDDVERALKITPNSSKMESLMAWLCGKTL